MRAVTRVLWAQAQWACLLATSEQYTWMGVFQPIKIDSPAPSNLPYGHPLSQETQQPVSDHQVFLRIFVWWWCHSVFMWTCDIYVEKTHSFYTQLYLQKYKKHIHLHVIKDFCTAVSLEWVSNGQSRLTLAVLRDISYSTCSVREKNAKK